MLPAEKTHYRKGLALGLTMAETFSIIVFILLLVCAMLLMGANDARDAAENDLQEVTVDYAIAKHMLQGNVPSGVNTDVWLRESRRLSEELMGVQSRIEELAADSMRARAEIEKLRQLLEDENLPSQLTDTLAKQAGHIEMLKDSLTQADDAIRELENRQESLNDQLQEALQIGETAREAIVRREDLDSTEVDEVLKEATRANILADSLEIARDAISSFEAGQAKWDSLASESSVDSLRAVAARERMRASSIGDILATAGRERDEAIDRAEFREAEVRRLRGGLGIDPPPCWLDDEKNPEYMFRAVLTDGGIRLFKIAPPHRGNDPATPYLSAIESGRIYAPQEFLDITRPIYATGLARTAFGPMGCRYWIRPVDQTGTRKDVFREREAQLWKRFWFRW